MNALELHNKIAKEIDLTVHSPISVSTKIPHYYSLCLSSTYKLVDQLICLETEYTQLNGERIKYYLDKADLQIKTRDDRNAVIASEETMRVLNNKIARLNNSIKLLENGLKLIKQTSDEIKNIGVMKKIDKGLI